MFTFRSRLFPKQELIESCRVYQEDFKNGQDGVGDSHKVNQSDALIALENDSRYMTEAIKEAVAAFDEDEVPIGCVIVYQGKIIGRAHNQRETLKDPTAHAEVLAITQAASYLDNWRLTGCTMYVTLEPCTMCAGALVLSRIDKVVYGPTDPKGGACGTLYNIVDDSNLNHRIEVVSDFMAEPSRKLLQDFFAQKRKQGKK